MGKKFFRTLLSALLFGCLMHAPAWAETAVVTGNDVNMREGPGTNFRILGSLPEGEVVTVTDRSNGSWYAVEYNGVTGFMSGNYLEVAEEEVAQPVHTAAQDALGPGIEGYVDAMYVRFRSAPGSEYSVRGEYNRGKPLQYYFTTGDWAACIIDGVPGYLYADYVAFGTFDGYGENSNAEISNAEDGYEEDGYNENVYGEDGYADNGELMGEELPLNLRISETPTPTPEIREPSYSDQLALEHASMPGVDQTPAYINANYVRFRKGPGSSYPIIETYNAGTGVGVTGVYMDWTACIIDGQFGFIYSDYVTIPGEEAAQEESFWEEEASTEVSVAATTNIPLEMPEIVFAGVEGYVAGNSVRMRSAPSMSAPVVAELSYGNVLNIVGRTGDWAAAICGSNAGYIYGQFVKLGSLNLTPQTGSAGGVSAPASLGGSSLEKGIEIAKYAVQFVGCPYSWGGKSPAGFDCSGLVYYVYEQFGITLNRVAQEQAENGVHVDPSELQPGDILCFYSGSSYIGHAGIYIGNGMFVHAQNSATGVVITELAGHYSERGFEARRIV